MRFAVALLLAVTVFAPAPSARAQDYAEEYDPSVLSACLQITHPRNHGRCIGLGAAHCMTSEIGGSNLGVGICFGSEGADWDARLNRAYQDLLKVQEQVAEDNAAYNPNITNAVDLLRDMQRNWIAYRDAACDLQYVQWGGGTGGGPASAQCVMELTAHQTLLLEGYLQ